MDEVWDADSDYYDSEEEEEALAGADVTHNTMCPQTCVIVNAAV